MYETTNKSDFYIVVNDCDRSMVLGNTWINIDVVFEKNGWNLNKEKIWT